MLCQDNDTDIKHEEKLPMPSFIRLFVMNRVLTSYISANDGESKTEMLLRYLTNSTKIASSKSTSIAHEIMVNLLKYGIKHYMKELYDEETQGSVIEQVFNKIIIEKFKKEYQQVTTYTTTTTSNKNKDENNDNHYYQRLLFNTTDLMCLVFQFLSDFGEDEMILELINCSLVNSHWLYHTWNPNSIYYVALIDLIGGTILHHNNKLYSRTWQRFYNAQKVYIYSSYNKNHKYLRLKTNDFVLKKISLFGNIRNLDGFVPDEHVSIIPVLMKKCGDKIERFSLSTFGNVDNNNTPLTLLNAKFITIVNMRLFFIWTIKCSTIKINWVDNISQKWCQHVIDKCDCGGVKSLTLDRSAFDHSVNTNVLKKFAQKFINLEHLVLEFYSRCDKHVLLLWSLLNPIIVKNSESGHDKVQVVSKKYNVQIQIFTESIHLKTVNDMIEKNKIIIDYIRLIVDDCWEEHQTEIIKLLSNKRLKWLQFTNSDRSNAQFPLVLQSLQNEDFLKQVKFDKLKKIEFQDNYGFGSSTMKMINQFLQLNWIVEKKVFVSTKFVVRHANLSPDPDSMSKTDFDAAFEKLCQNIVRLMMKDKIAIDIKVTFEILLDDKFSVNDCGIKIFEKYFDLDKIMQSYQVPSWNEFCIGLQQPLIFFGIQDNWQGEKKDVLRVATVEDNSEMYTQ